MGGFRDIPIRQKLILITMMTSAAALLLACIAFLTNDIISMRARMTSELITLSEILGANSTAPIVFGDNNAATENLGILSRKESIVSAAIYDVDGKTFARYLRPDTTFDIPAARTPGVEFHYSEDRVELFRNIVLDGEVIGKVYVRSDVRELRDRLWWYLTAASGVLLVSLLVAYLMSARLQKLVTRPILSLARTARTITAERNYSVRAPAQGRDEIGELIDGFNEMLSEIESRDSELALHRNQLEDIVAQRTEELKAANKALARAKESAEDAADRMTHQAHHDALTGLPNRTLLVDRLVMGLAHAERNNQQLALLFLDLDRFKIINDSLGHAFGDQILRVVAERILGCVRNDDTVARLGGDEFMVLLPGIEAPRYAGHVAQKIIAALEQPIMCDNHELHITTSIGISVYPNDGTDDVTLVKRADISMYRAKDKGRNNYLYYTSDMDALSHKRLVMENHLRRALERGELELYYQPKVDACTQRIVGAEALLRWNNPELGQVPTMEFISLAEETGMIVQIGEWVLQTACNNARAWHDAGYSDLLVAVNLSTHQLRKHYLLEAIRDILKDSTVDPTLIELEITESVVMQNAQSTVNTLKELKEMGVQIAIDDFGTGYSSLSYLRRFPVDTVKIDCSFVRDIPENAEDASIATAIIAMAHSLSLSVVAEGVENAQQLRFLREHNCDLLQGNLFSPAVTAREFGQLLVRDAMRADNRSDG